MVKRKKAGCYLCGSLDHRAKLCPSAKCSRCNSVGHDAGGCPTKPLPPVDRGHFAATKNDSTVPKHSSFTYIELFAGMGGFRVALDTLGGKCVFASETDRFCIRNYQLNFGGDRPAGDICRIQSDWIPEHDLLVGGFPCQPFSSSGSRQGMDDPKGLLFREIVRILRAKQPKAFLLENVRGLLLHNNGKSLQRVTRELQECGYRVQSELLDAIHLLPQERCRLYIVGIHQDCCDIQEKPIKYNFPALQELNRGIRDILQRTEGGKDALSLSDLEKLRLSHHQIEKVQSQSYTKRHPEARFLKDTSKAAKTIQSSYSKYMVGSQFVAVEDAVGANQTGSTHWRRFSSREAARLQGFPELFHLCPERAIHMIGNAVAPPLISMVAAPLLQMLGLLSPSTNDCREKCIGWLATKHLLLEASPNDGRREKLRCSLDSCALG